jgi:hypothetical protein
MKSATAAPAAARKEEPAATSSAARFAIEEVRSLPPEGERGSQPNAKDQTDNLIDFRKHRHTFQLYAGDCSVSTSSSASAFNSTSTIHQSSEAYGE